MIQAGKLRSYLHLHFLVLIWGFTAIVGLFVSVSPIVLVFYRTFFAAIGLAVVLLIRKKSFAVPVRDIIKMLLVGIVLSSHWILFFASARVSTASVCLAGMATTSLWTSLIEPLVHRKPIRVLEVGLGVLAFAGLYMVFKFEFDHVLGLTLALLSALLAALFTVANSKLVQRNDAFAITFYEMVGASFFSLIVSIVAEKTNFLPKSSFLPEVGDWPWILFLALICTVYASSMAVQLMKQFSAYLINLTINLEPVYGIILAVAIFGEKERMTEGFYWGIVLILLAVILYPFLNQILYYQRNKVQH